MKTYGKNKFLSVLLIFCFAVTNIIPLNAMATEKKQIIEEVMADPAYDSPEYADWKQAIANLEMPTELEIPENTENITESGIPAVVYQSPQRAILTSTTSNDIISNDFVEFAVGSYGRFTIGTTGGNPDNANDNNKKMLYGHPFSTTSYTTIRLDDINHTYTTQDLNFDQDRLRCTSQYTYNDISVKQVLSIVYNNATQRKDTVQIKYIVKNNDDIAHDTGLRIMMDTMLGANDAAPFRIPGIGAVTKELELSGDDIPEYWQAFDNLTDPSVISQGNLLKDYSNKPDKVQFTNWRRVYNTSWGYTVNPSYTNGDSAVSVIWESMPLLPGDTEEYVTYYGLNEFEQNLDDFLSVSITGTASVEATETGYEPNPFTVTSYIQNTGSSIARNVKAKVILPDELKLAPHESMEKDLDNLASGNETQASWRIQIEPQDEERTLTYSVVVSAEGIEPVTVSKNIVVPPLSINEEILYEAGIEGISEGTTCAVGDPVNIATGNYITSKTDLIIDGHTPLVFSRFYNSMDNWQSSLGTNWHHDYEMKLTSTDEGKVKITFNDGHVEEFILNDEGKYISMLGKYSELKKDLNENYKLTLGVCSETNPKFFHKVQLSKE
ncbi:MAG: DUF6531 domain-containing protein [Clostridia bacterium]|nr:DUF6531 domain-containing protein [Clostridia bacterium]MDD4049348.1 DUF6531 domain-containing protein [Clostridia bacterium]